jgi:chromosome segregation ATPase
MMKNNRNSEAALAEYARRAKDALQRGETAGADALEAFREAGREISKMKEILPHGSFGSEVERLCGCSLQWARRLMKLHRDWDDYQSALSWSQKTTNGCTGKRQSVDGALAIVNEWKRAMSGVCPEARKTRENWKKKYEGDQATIAALRKEYAALQQELAVANAMIRFFQQKLDGLALQPSKVRQDLNEKTRDRIDKVIELVLRGATEGERVAALCRLDDIAQERGWDLASLMSEFGLETKVGFPFAPAA